ncbi:MAG: cytochrome c biogenesis protein CcdA [archaeon]
MKRILVFLFALLVLASLVSSQSTVESCYGDIKCANENYCIYYFYGDDCSHCAKIKPVIDDLEKRYTNFTFHRLEVWNNDTNAEMFKDFASRYEIKRTGVPAIFVGDQAYIGDSTIKNNLEQALEHFLIEEPVCPLDYNGKEPGLHDISPTRNINLTIPAVIVAGFIDSLNPCAFAVLAFLLIYLSGMTSKRRMLKVGLTYIFTVFIVYFLSGLGLFVAIQSLGISRIFFYIAAWLVIIAGVINVKDFFWYGKGFSLAIPRSKMPLIKKHIEASSIASAIILGILVSLFELPCTGGVYIAILSLLASNLTQINAIPWLLLYNFIFVLPLFIILFLVYFGMSAEKADKIRVERRKWLRLVMGAGMIALGWAMLAGLFG